MTYPGGKNGSGVYQKIINQIPPHTRYVEAFAGHGGIFQNKKPAESTIVIDVDENVFQYWLDHIATNGGIGDRKESVTVIKGDAISHLRKCRYGPETFVYCDPPYLLETRKSKRKLYDHEFWTPAQHRRLLNVLRSLNCMVAISGYPSALYAQMLADWRVITYQAVTRQGRATEYLWMNYPEPMALHDYRYLGENYREREKIAKQKRRWRARLQRMPLLQRYALLSSVDEFSDSFDRTSTD